MIDKSKIKRYIASGLLGTTILTGCGIIIKETTTNHTEELCPITKILNVIDPKDSSPLGIVLHQIPAMQKDYKDNEMGNVAISYLNYDEHYIETVYCKPIGKSIENGQIKYLVPEGYTIYPINDYEYMCKKDISKIKSHHDLVAETPYVKKLKID